MSIEAIDVLAHSVVLVWVVPIELLVGVRSVLQYFQMVRGRIVHGLGALDTGVDVGKNALEAQRGRVIVLNVKAGVLRLISVPW